MRQPYTSSLFATGKAQALPMTAAQINEPQTGKVTIEVIRRKKNGERFFKPRSVRRKRR